MTAPKRTVATTNVTVEPGGPTRPGWATSEFWSTILVHVAAIAALVHPGFDTGPWVQPAALLAASIAQGVYSHGRSQLKQAQVTAFTGFAAQQGD